MKILNLLLNRAREPVERRSFRFSDARNETARYRVDFTGYQPIELPGDPVVDDQLPRRQARLVFDRLEPIASQRRTILTAYLAGFGLVTGERAEDWQRIEQWLDDVIEGSAEPADRQWPRLRPMAEALLLDLALVFAEAARTHLSGSLRFGFEGDTLDKGVGRCDGFPTLVDPDGQLRCAPRALFLFLGVRAANRTTAERTVLARAWHELDQARVLPTAADVAEELYRWVDEHQAETGELPSLADLAEYAIENRIAEEWVPRDLIERLGGGSESGTRGRGR